MNVKTIKDCGEIPAGSLIRDVRMIGEYYEGLWCSSGDRG
jgi:hypothetical protein